MPAYPAQREMAPDFTLQSSTGRAYQLSSFRGRRNLLLLFLADGKHNTEALVTALAAHREELEQEEETQVLLVFRGNMVSCEALRRRDHIPFTVLADEDGRVHDRYGAANSPALYLTDRYGEIYDARRISEGAALPDADDILASVRHINAACPE